MYILLLIGQFENTESNNLQYFVPGKKFHLLHPKMSNSLVRPFPLDLLTFSNLTTYDPDDM